MGLLMTKIKIGYDHSKIIFNECWRDCIIRYYEIFGNDIPEVHTTAFYIMLSKKINDVKKAATEEAPVYEYSFDDNFLREFIETDNKEFAKMLYHDAEDPEIRTYLKMRWAF